MSKAIARPPVDYTLLANRTCLITGGASGLGAAVVTQFAAHGAYVTIADRSEENGQALAKSLTDKDQHVTFIKCDTTIWAEQVAAFKHAIKFGVSGELDVVVLMAGVGGEGAGLVDLVLREEEPSLESELSERPGHKAVDVNLEGVYLGTWLALYFFRLKGKSGAEGGAGRKKSLVMVSSMAGYVSGLSETRSALSCADECSQVDFAYNTGYSTSKFGVRGIFRSIRGAAHQVDARVNNLAPGYISTPLTMLIHGITSPDQPSKKAGKVLPWAPVDYVVEAVGRCAVDENVDGMLLVLLTMP